MSRHPDDDVSRENVASCCHFVAAGDSRANGRDWAPNLLIPTDGIDGGVSDTRLEPKRLRSLTWFTPLNFDALRASLFD